MIRRFEPLDIHFKCAVRRIAANLFPCGYDVGEEAPSTLAELNAHIAATGRMLVYSGGSDRTIFDCPETNYAFRAWHDWCHWKGQHEFDMQGEAAVCLMQHEHLTRLYGGHPSLPKWHAIIDAEVIGQNAYHDMYGVFPQDQKAFVLRYLNAQKAIRDLRAAGLAA